MLQVQRIYVHRGWGTGSNLPGFAELFTKKKRERKKIKGEKDREKIMMQLLGHTSLQAKPTVLLGKRVYNRLEMKGKLRRKKVIRLNSCKCFDNI